MKKRKRVGEGRGERRGVIQFFDQEYTVFD
jgi:hypothetical protein